MNKLETEYTRTRKGHIGEKWHNDKYRIIDKLTKHCNAMIDTLQKR